jgi:polyketide synthase 13
MEPVEVSVVAAWLTERIAALLEEDPATLDPDVPLDAYGVASSDVVFLTEGLSTLLGLPVSATVAWEHPTIADLAEFLAAVSRGEAELPEDELAFDLDAQLHDP